MIFNKSKTKAEDKALIDVFSALGDKTRFQLLNLLSSNKDICVSELAEEVGISNAGVSQQLKVLEQAGLVERIRMGQKICYQIRESDNINKKVLRLMSE